MRKIVILVAILVTFFTVSTAHAQKPSYVRYLVTGAHFDVTYTNRSGATEQQDAFINRFEYKFDAPSGSFLYISAQNNGVNGGVRCMIDVNGKRLEYARSFGEYVIATCSATVP